MSRIADDSTDTTHITFLPQARLHVVTHQPISDIPSETARVRRGFGQSRVASKTEHEQQRRSPLRLILACLLLLASETKVQGHTVAPFYRSLSTTFSEADQDLLAQAKALLALYGKTTVGEFSTTCSRIQKSTSGVRETSPDNPVAALALATLDARAYLDGALARLAVLAQRVQSAEVLYLQGHALAAWEEPADLSTCQAQRRTAQAVEQLSRLRSAYPDYRAAESEEMLAVLLTRQSSFELAAAAYRRALMLTLEPTQVSTLYANLGEVTMLSGDLEAALASYEQALSKARSSKQRALALWGQAMVQNRLGEHEAALASTRRAMALEGGQMHVLRADGVFFEPAHEIHQYEALGHEAQADAIPAYAPIALQEAEAALLAFLKAAQSSPEPNFTDTAQRDLKRIEARLSTALSEAITLP